MKPTFVLFVAVFLVGDARAQEAWQTHKAEAHGFSLSVPPGTKFAERKFSGGWVGLQAKVDGVELSAITRRGKPASAEEIQEYAVEALQIAGSWTPVTESRNVRGWRWYRVATATKGDVLHLVLYGVGEAGNCLFVVKTTRQDYAADQAAHRKWYESVRLHRAGAGIAAVIRAEFARWDADRDGRLTTDEVDRAVSDPGVRGDSAAALAVIKSVERQNTDQEQKTPPVTLAMVAKYEADKAAGKVEDDEDYDQWFREYQGKLASTARELFPQKVPRVSAVKQGDLGDCFCVAMIGAAVARDPQELVRAISQNRDGTYTVRFAGAATVTIRPPTDTEIAINSSAGENGLWLTVYEKACGAVAARLTPPAGRKRVETDIIAYGGLASGVVEVFTGHECRWMDRTDDGLPRAIAAGISGRCLMYTVMRPKVDVPAGLINGHVYAVIGFDAKKREVTIFDPRGVNHSPKGPPGPRRGFEMMDGVFTVSLTDYIAVFDGVGIEVRK